MFQDRRGSRHSISRLAPSLLFLALLLALPGLCAGSWQRIYGGSGQDRGYSVQQTTDGGFIVAGITTSFDTQNDWEIYLVKTDASGDTLWTRAISDPNGVMSYSDFVEGQQTADGGYVVAGTMYGYPFGYQAWLIKTDELGRTEWTRKFGGKGNEGAYSVQQTSDGGFILAGYTDTATPGTRHIYLVKTDAAGDSVWTRTFGGSSNDYGYSVRQTLDGGYIVAGLTQSFGGGLQAYLARTTASGSLVWQRAYGGPAQDQAYSVAPTSDGGFIVAGMTYDPARSYQAWLIKTDASGDTLWTGKYGGTGTEYAQSVEPTSDGGYVAAGFTNSWTGSFQVYLFQTDASGVLKQQRTFAYPGFDYDFGMSVQQTSNGGCVIAGYTDNYGNGDKVYLVDTDSLGISGVAARVSARPRPAILAAPNPFVSFATIPGHETERFDLFDLRGAKAGIDRGDRIGARLPPGIYFLKPEARDAAALKVVKLR